MFTCYLLLVAKNRLVGWRWRGRGNQRKRRRQVRSEEDFVGIIVYSRFSADVFRSVWTTANNFVFSWLCVYVRLFRSMANRFSPCLIAQPPLSLWYFIILSTCLVHILFSLFLMCLFLLVLMCRSILCSRYLHPLSHFSSPSFHPTIDYIS